MIAGASLTTAAVAVGAVITTASGAIDPNAVLGAIVTCTLFLATAMWKLASMLGEIRTGTNQIRTTLEENRESISHLNERVTEHRRRTEATIAALREFMSEKFAGMATGHIRDEAVRAMLHELGSIPDEPEKP